MVRGRIDYTPDHVEDPRNKSRSWKSLTSRRSVHRMKKLEALTNPHQHLLLGHRKIRRFSPLDRALSMPNRTSCYSSFENVQTRSTKRGGCLSLFRHRRHTPGKYSNTCPSRN